MLGLRSPQILAHRGALREAPENTLPAFARALELGADGIELDVHLSRDGRLVVIHDFDLEGTTNGHGPVTSLTSVDLARLDAGSHFDRSFAAVGVPTLDEVLDLVGDRCRVNVEVKSVADDGGPAPDVLARLVRDRPLYDQVIVSSSNLMTLVRLRQLEPAIARGIVYEAPLTPEWQADVLRSIRPQALHPQFACVTHETVAWARAEGLAVTVWTVNDVREARRLQELGVDAIITDVPDLLIQELF
jgi:glycerophosphoryl diester phosphodiesterase